MNQQPTLDDFLKLGAQPIDIRRPEAPAAQQPPATEKGPPSRFKAREYAFMGIPEAPIDDPYRRRGERYVQRAGETFLGMAGDIARLGRAGVQLAMGETPREEQNFAQRWANDLIDAIPGSEQIREMSAREKPHLEPQSAFEEKEDEIVQDMTAVLTGGPGSIMKAVGMVAAGQLGKEGVKLISEDPAKQEMGKLGGMIFAGLFSKGGGVRNYIKNQYDQARASVPEGAKLKYPKDAITKVEKQLLRGTIDDTKESGLKIVKDIKQKMKTGAMRVDEAVQFDKDINRAIAKATSKAEAGNLKQLKKAHAQALGAYAKENPAWGQFYNEAKMAYAGMERSFKAQRALQRYANLNSVPSAAAVLGLQQYLIPGFAAQKLGATGGVLGLLWMHDMSQRLSTNPALRRYYGNVMKAALKENKASMIRNLKGMEKVAQKEFEDNPLPPPLFPG